MNIYIVTPTFNSCATIEDTLASVLNQLNPEKIHYHVQDGGSQDNTMAILDSWKHKFKQRGISFTFTSEPDKGMYDAIIKGFSHFEPEAKDWMSWINSDDQLSGLFSYTLLKLPNSIYWVTGKPTILNRTGKIMQLERYYSTKLVKEGLCNGANWFYLQQEGTAWRHKAWTSANGSQTLKKYKYAGDFHLWRELAKKTELYQCNFTLGIFNLRDGQISQVAKEKYLEEILLKQESSIYPAGFHLVNMIIQRHNTILIERHSLKISSKESFELERLECLN